MKVLNIEDDVYKQVNISKVLKGCGITDIDYADNLNDGYQKILSSRYDLVITDMQYPLYHGETIDKNSGDILIGRIIHYKINTHVILISSIQYRYEDIYGCLRYSENSDWDMQLIELVNRLKKEISCQ